MAHDTAMNDLHLFQIHERLKGLAKTIRNIDDMVGGLRSNTQINWYRWILIIVFSVSLVFLVRFAILHTTSNDSGLAIILFGVAIQAVTLLIAVSLLLVRQDVLSDEDRLNLGKIAEELNSTETRLKDVESTIRDPSPGTEGLEVERFGIVDQELLKIESSVKRLEFISRGWKITLYRALFGMIFAVTSLVSSALPTFMPPAADAGGVNDLRDNGAFPEPGVGTTKPTDNSAHITNFYLSFAVISCACAAASFAMLGRRRTDEQKFLGDFMQVNGTLRAITETVSHAARLKQ